MNMIELRGVTKRFDGFTALSSLDLTVPQGAVYGLIGPNGAGKTTAIRHITGMLRPDEGQVLLSGEPVFENPPVKVRLSFKGVDTDADGMIAEADFLELLDGAIGAYDALVEKYGAKVDEALVPAA